MKKILLLLLIAGSLNGFAQPKSYDYAYMNKKGICVYSAANKMEYLIASKGQDPRISPDGRKLAYTAFNAKGDRFIAVVDLTTKKKIIFNTRSNNCYGPVWSPDGKFIAYNVFDAQKSNWLIAVIDSGNTAFKILTGSLEQSYSPTWTHDSKNVAVQNMEKVFVLDLNGNVIKQYNIADMTKDSGPSSSDRFQFTADNQKIAFSTEVNEPGGTDGPPTAVFIYDINRKTSLRLSPKGYFCDDVIVKGNKVLFTGSKIKSLVENVYAVDTNGTNFKILLPGCGDVSAKE